jgi:choline dehydrogenase-like flavoprotein
VVYRSIAAKTICATSAPPVLGNAFGPDDERNPRVFVDDQGREPSWCPSDGYSNNAACVGGGTFSYGAMAWRYMEKDFRMRSTYGAVAGSTLEDWPISYADLEPYYEKAEWEIGVSGDDSGNIFRAPRRKPLPMPPLAAGREHEILKPAAQRLGCTRSTFPCCAIPCPTTGAGLHALPLVRGLRLRSERQMRHPEYRDPQSAGHRQLRLRTECMTREILTDDRGKATGVAYFDAHDRLQEQMPTWWWFRRGGGIGAPAAQFQEPAVPRRPGQSLRLGGPQFPGPRYTGAFGIMISTSTTIWARALPSPSAITTTAIRAGGRRHAGQRIHPPAHTSSWACCRRACRAGAGAQGIHAQFYRRTMIVMGPVQEMPMFDSRVQVDPKVKDYWGIPGGAAFRRHRIRTPSRWGSLLAAKAEAWLKEAGRATTWTFLPGPGFSGGQHQAGTCRMGDDPKTSVVNKYCQVHDVDNLFVIDGSVHVTNGGFNPALTIMANRLSRSDHLVKGGKERHGQPLPEMPSAGICGLGRRAARRNLQRHFSRRRSQSPRALMDDCLRCHAMHFNGSIRDLVRPLDTKGPWQLRDPKLAGQPVIPCLACHQMHRQGNPLVRATEAGQSRPDPGNLPAITGVFRPARTRSRSSRKSSAAHDA